MDGTSSDGQDDYITVVGIAGSDNVPPPEYTPHVPEGHRVSRSSAPEVFTPPPSTSVDGGLISNEAFLPDEERDADGAHVSAHPTRYASHEDDDVAGRPWYVKACWWSFMGITLMVIVVAAVVVVTGECASYI